jgi:hypothetical protein
MPMSSNYSVTVGGHRRLVWGLAVTRDGRGLVAVVPCGGALHARETPHTVMLTWIASSVGAGGMACARVPLQARLSAPLGHRVVVDTVTHRRMRPYLLCRPAEHAVDLCVRAYQA